MNSGRIYKVFSLVLLSTFSAATALAQCSGTSTNSTCTSTTAASVTDTNAASQPPATYSPYPDTVTVSGMSGTVATVTVTLNGFSGNFVDSSGFMLVAPDGTHNLVFLSNTGAAAAKIGLTLTFDDAAAGTVPDG